MSDAPSLHYEHEERIAELEEMVLDLEGMLFDAQEERDCARSEADVQQDYIEELEGEIKAWEESEVKRTVSQETIWDMEELIKIANQVYQDLDALE